MSVAHAARNNAAWCDAVCSAHGAPGVFTDTCWSTSAPAPPLHPNLVTLDPALEPALAAVRALECALPSRSWAVKDSFGALSLEHAGFRLLFEAEWIACSARPEPPAREWSRIREAESLARWEAAWGESAGQARLFLPSLLQHPDVAILAAASGDGVIRAGIVANRAAGAVGVSNFFGPASFRAGGVAAAAHVFPGLPLVGYESGPALEQSRALGFEAIGPLRVWARQA